ncbi:MAG TPA: hypothetical protein DEG42_01445 [Acholeplasmataceae bacterium]|nr:hypothetical protein [Acholeplasmataceae bacterium]
MNMNLMHIKKQVRNRKEQKIYESKPIGSAIKFKRKEMNMTLEEGAEGICSVSYLSKLENNLIEAGVRFVPSLIERFNLEDVFDQDDEMYQLHIRTIKDCLFDGTKPEEDMPSFYGKRKDYQALLVKMGYYILLDQYDEASKSIHDLRVYIPNLTQDEFGLFTLLAGMMLYDDHKYSDGYELLLLAPKFEDLEYKVVLMLLKFRLFCAFKMHKISEVLNNYPLYVNMTVDIEKYDLLQDMRNQYVQFEAIYKNPEDMERILGKMSTLSQELKDYTVAKSMFYHGEYEDVILASKPYYRKHSHWLVLYVISLDYMKKNEDIQYFLDHLDELEDVCKTSKLLIAHLKHKHKSDKTQLLNYLRREILGIKHLSDEYQVLDYLMMDAQNLFSLHQHYKEAVQVTSHFIPKLKRLGHAERTFQTE